MNLYSKRITNKVRMEIQSELSILHKVDTPSF